MGATASNKKYGKPRTGTGGRYSDTFKGFVDLNLSDVHRDELEELIAQEALDAEQFLQDLMEEGYKFSLAYDAAHSCHIATATGKTEKCANQGYALSGRGPTSREAMYVLWHKVTNIAHWGNWVEEGARQQQQLPLWR